MTADNITIESLLKQNRSILADKLIETGLPHEKINDALEYMNESVIYFIKTELNNNNIRTLLLSLTGNSSSHHEISIAILHYSKLLQSRLHINLTHSQEIAQGVIPNGLESVGEHFPWAKLNREGISNLIKNSISKS